MEVITNLIELFLHIDEYLAEIISQYHDDIGRLIYSVNHLFRSPHSYNTSI